MKILDEVIKAEKRIRNFIWETPLIPSQFLSFRCGCNVYLKLENQQVTGSFKVRGAFNKILSLKEEKRGNEVITASTGNHGIAVGYAGRVLNTKVKVVVPENISSFKLRRLEEKGVNVEIFGIDCVQAEYFAKKRAEEERIVYISPYNDSQIVAGQGTIGVEIAKQISNLDSLIVPVGGGGLISGIAVFLKSNNKKLRVFGCLPENSPVMSESIKKGKIVEMETKETISDATAGGIEEGSITFEICKKYVDDFFLVSEKEIENSIHSIYEHHKIILEGAGALPVATILRFSGNFKNQNVVLLFSGSNIDMEFFKRKFSNFKNS